MKLKNIFNRMVIVGLLIVLQLGILITVIWKLSTYFMYFYGISLLLSAVVLLYLISKKGNSSYKIAWAIPILLFPVFGGFLYILLGNTKTNKKLTRGLKEINNRTIQFLKQDPKIIEDIQGEDRSIANQMKYIKDFSLFPVYKNTTSEYLSPGEDFYRRLIEELKKAEHFIFLEYFIIREGTMWNGILDILEEKVKQGVDVRLIYDDIGCLKTLPYKYNERIEKLGIKCMVFNKLAPVVSLIMNNRDHRKITVIDGHTGL
nr:PLDc N-terminal domain-containing protein [Cellulosilyticum ruminicola]